MQNRRFIILLADGRQQPPDAMGAQVRGCLPDGVLLGHDGLTLAIGSAHDAIDLAGSGWIVGDMFRRHGPLRRITALSMEEAAAIRTSAGQVLVSQFWGNYVAVTHGPDGWTVLRAPLGTLPCYYSRCDWGHVLSAEAALLHKLQPAATIDWSQVALDLYARDLQSGHTALVGIKEVLPGNALHFRSSGTCRTAEVWSPWSFTAPGPRVDRIDGLRRTIQNSAHALTSDCRQPLLSLSGGLDSSIVAACLTGRAGGFNAATVVSRDPNGDERTLARLTAERTGAPLFEVFRDLATIDLSRSVVSHLPRTGGWTHAQAYRTAIKTALSASCSDALVTGHGGDNVFYNTRSARPALDALYARAPISIIGHAVHDIATLADAGWAAVVREALRTFWRTGRGYRWHRNPSLLTPAACASCEAEMPAHPWLAAPPAALPGKAAQIGMILQLQAHCEVFDRAEGPPVLHPLAAQPVVEACLAIPSWEEVEGGRDRAVARRAFARDLPEAIIQRRSKGSPEGFAIELLESRLGEIRERLLAGHLVRRGIVNRPALNEALNPAEIRTGTLRPRLLALLDTEAWLDHWIAA